MIRVYQITLKNGLALTRRAWSRVSLLRRARRIFGNNLISVDLVPRANAGRTAA